MKANWFCVVAWICHKAGGATRFAQCFRWFGSSRAMQQSAEVAARLSQIHQLLAEHAENDWLLEKKPIAILDDSDVFASVYL
jgi:hypothetical protein